MRLNDLRIFILVAFVLFGKVIGVASSAPYPFIKNKTVGLQSSMWTYSHNEIGGTVSLLFNKNPYTYGVAPLFITDDDNVRLGVWTFCRASFASKNSKLVSSFVEMGLKYAETNGGTNRFRANAWLNYGTGINIKVNRVDQIGVSFGALIDPFAVNDTSRKLYLGYIRLSYTLNGLI